LGILGRRTTHWPADCPPDIASADRADLLLYLVILPTVVEAIIS
jgi:hypothetical protein